MDSFTLELPDLETRIDVRDNWSQVEVSRPLPHDPAWRVILQAHATAGQLAIDGYLVVPTLGANPTGPPHARALRNFPWANLVDVLGDTPALFAEAAEQAPTFTGSAESMGRWQDLAEQIPSWDRVILDAPSRPGRAGLPDAHWAAWARCYVEAAEAAPANPNVALAARFPTLGIDVVRRKVKRARELGYLAGGRQGTPGGTLTAKARDVLDHADLDATLEEMAR